MERNDALGEQIATVLGLNYSVSVYHKSYRSLHRPADENSFYSDEQEQTYDDFIEIGKRNPNIHGTGRWKLNKQRNKLGLFYFGNKDRTDLQNVADYLSAFIGLEVILICDKNALDISENTFRLAGNIYNINCWEKRRKGNKNSKYIVEKYVDVFSLFDALVHVAKPPFISIVGLFDCKLAESDNSKSGYFEVLGRACGDRVSCISLTECTKSLFSTMVHEILHTIGFDHCNLWECVMNALQTENIFLFLSPVNLRKLIQFHGINEHENGAIFLIQRYELLKSVLLRYGSYFNEEVKWIEEKVITLNNVCTLESKVEDNLVVDLTVTP